MTKKIAVPLLILIVGLVLAYSLATNKPRVQSAPYEPMATTVRVITVRAVDEYLTIRSQGTVQAQVESELIPQVSGVVIWTSPSLVVGGSFQEGEILARIDDADYLTAVDLSRAEKQRAEIEREFANDELARVKSLYQQSLGSQKQLDSARRNAKLSEANLIASNARLEQAERDLSRTALGAPFDGLVRSERVDVGQFLNRGSAIGTLFATDYAEVRLPIPTDQVVYSGLPVSTRGNIPEGLRPPVSVSAELGDIQWQWDGQLVRVEAEIDEYSRMLYGVVRLRQISDDVQPLLPIGLFVRAEIRGRKVNNVYRLPRSSLRDGDRVLVVDADNTLHFRDVSILRLEHHEVLIDGGLADGEKVCISVLQAVVEGMLVKPITE